MNPLISILMPVKNAGKFLDDCIDSIYQQDFQDWELIAVNDHSTDDSREILKSWSEKDGRIHFLNNEGSGIIPALRLAYSKSSGSMIHRMDADDLMTKDKLSHLSNSLEKEGIGTVVTAKVSYFAEGGISDGYRKYQDWLNEMIDENNHWDQIYQECVIASPCWMIYREDFDRCGAFDSELYPEDYDLAFRFYENGLRVKGIDKLLHLWRDHSERSSRNDINYQDSSFFAMKLHYYIKLEMDPNRPLLVWGAGPKGKKLAKLLKEAKVDFKWVSNNPNKHGKDIYGQLMRSFKEIIELNRPQVIVTVAQRNAKKEIIAFLHENDLKEKEDFWFFR